MPHTNVLLHYIWSTKARKKIITPPLKSILLSHIKSNSVEKSIFIDTMECVDDHIHLLISMSRDQTISKIAQLIKGESSNWINKPSNAGLLNNKFEWQDEYMALSVSLSTADRVRSYIRNQEQRHKKITFQEE